MAFQFIHVSTYSVKSGGAGIAAEAGRKPDHSRHVDNPKPPVLLAGMEPEAAWAEIERRHGGARNTVTTKTGKQAQRKLRKDENVLLAAVASYPTPTEELDLNDPEFQKWKDQTLEFFRKSHGEPLSAVLHLDESHPHIHFLTAPDLEHGERMADRHPGERAKRDVGGRNGRSIEKKRAYKEAMRQYQDDYHDSVSKYFGHVRLGPQRQRLTRDEYKAQQAEAQRIAQRLKDFEASEKAQQQRFQAEMKKITTARENLAESRQDVEKGQKSVQKAERQVERSAENVDRQKSSVDRLKAQLDQRQKQIASRERRMAGLWGGLVSFVTLGKAGTKKRIEDAQKAAKEDSEKQIARAQAKSEKAQRVLQKRVKTVSQERDILKRQKTSLETKLSDAQGAQATAERSFKDMQKTYQPLQAEKATLAKDLRITKAFISDLEKAAESGDIDQLLDKLKKDGPEPLDELFQEHDRDHGGPGLG